MSSYTMGQKWNAYKKNQQTDCSLCKRSSSASAPTSPPWGQLAAWANRNLCIHRNPMANAGRTQVRKPFSTSRPSPDLVRQSQWAAWVICGWAVTSTSRFKNWESHQFLRKYSSKPLTFWDENSRQTWQANIENCWSVKHVLESTNRGSALQAV